MADMNKLKVPGAEPVDLSTLPRKMPKIEIDYAKCTVPMWCKQCLQTCPQMVFSTYCKLMAKFKESDVREPGVYEIIPALRHRCTMCSKCVDACPEGAITITFDDTVLKGTPKFDTAEAARESSYEIWQAPQPYSFELNEDMLALLREEFDPPKIIAGFARAIAGKNKGEVADIAKEILGQYGRAWMQKVFQLGEEYSDRTYEMMKEVADRTGEQFFPLVPQRFIEIAYLSTQEFLKLNILENWMERLIYEVPNCYTYRQISEQCGAETVELMSCKHACLSGLETLFAGLDLDVAIDMDTETARDDSCQFRITRI